MDRYYDTGLKVVQKDDEFFIIREDKMTQSYSVRAKIVTEAATGGMVEREGAYVQNRFEAGEYSVTLGTDHKDNWICPKGGTARVRLDWQELLTFIRAHEPNKPIHAGGFINTPSIQIDGRVIGENLKHAFRQGYDKQ